MIAGVEIKNVLRDPDHAHFGVVCHPNARTLYILLMRKI